MLSALCHICWRHFMKGVNWTPRSKLGFSWESTESFEVLCPLCYTSWGNKSLHCLFIHLSQLTLNSWSLTPEHPPRHVHCAIVQLCIVQRRSGFLQHLPDMFPRAFYSTSVLWHLMCFHAIPLGVNFMTFELICFLAILLGVNNIISVGCISM